MVTKLLAFFHRQVSRPLTRREPYFQWRSFSYTIDLPSECPSSSDHSFIPVHSISSNPSFSLLGFCKNIDYLKKVHALFFVSGIKGDLLCDTKLVSLYGTFGHVGVARLVFDRIPEPDFYSWKVMIRWACYELQDIDEGRKVHCEIIKVGNPDSFVQTGLVDMMLAAFVQNDCSKEALVLLNRMRETMVESNHFTLVSLVTACGKLGALHQRKWVHGYAIKTGIKLNSYLVTAVIDMYAKCGSLRDARSVFDKLSSVDLVSMCAVEQFEHRKVSSFFGDSAWSYRVNCVVNALVDMYAKCGAIREARYIFETVSDKNLIAWNTIISGYSQNGFAYDALEVFHQMRSKSVSPDSVTLVSILSACASLGALQVGSSLHAYSIKAGLLSSSVHVGTTLLNFYAKCGDSKSARVVFDSMGEKNTVTWSAMIGGYGIQGDSSGSLALFSDMIKENLEPNEVIFTTILSACSHTGRLGEGWKCFNSMCNDYNFVPSVKHYACMVDMLARAGRLEEAFDFIEKLPFKPDVRLFGAFLHGCGLHSRFDLGEAAIKKMLNLHPDKACYYVLISNLYASDGRWAQVNQVRELMKQRGLSKDPGCSITETETNKHLGRVFSQ
ncbi:T-box transcription factor TBX5, putative isoform 1 [Hibiscus syriacus]|uniref:T-box transcription factor TBX5, putative isoform 1 n=1 Tax=Hibiscus syriacus TaxID=106335 RepID=A0A6A2XFU3_HIBSY|nr:T-box transcription factor TBX5, putative isoform 1 [Hibiscus syriacus]